jgi:hypothetical protein
MSTPQRRILDVPLAPALLEEIGMFASLPKSAPGTDPVQSWQGTFQIWTCHGYDTNGNFDAGYLHVAKERDGDMFKLDVTQKIVLLRGIVNTMEATITCRDDVLGTPIDCRLENRFEDSEGNAIDDLSGTYLATLEGDQWRYRMNGRNGVKDVAGALSSDWSLLDAVQRLPFAPIETRFDMLEHMTVLKPGQVLRYRGDLAERIAFEDLALECYTRYGYATVPQEYWVNVHHRLVMVVAYNMVYLLNDNAPALYERELANRRGQNG